MPTPPVDPLTAVIDASVERTIRRLLPHVAEVIAQAVGLRTEADDGLLDSKQAAAMLGVSVALLQKWRRVGGGPPHRRLGSRAVRYDRRELVEWAERSGQRR